MSYFIAASDDGSYYLTSGGIAAIIILIVILLAAIAFIKKGDGEQNRQNPFAVKQLVLGAAALALAFVTSYIKIFSLPWGGSVTLCSMLFVTLIGYWYGPKIGITAGFAYGLLEFVQDGGSYILDPLQAGLDYIFAFAALGISGFFSKRKNGLLTGYIVAILARGLFHSIGGYIYWMDYMPESFPSSLKMIYPLAYNYSYIIAEGLITVIIISIPAVKHALARIKSLAIS